MLVSNRAERPAFVTADQSTVRELAHPDWAPEVGHQSLAEARVPPAGETAEHFHPESEELYYFLSGSGRMRLGEAVFDVREGDCVVNPPGVRHKLWNAGPAELVLLCCCAPAYSDADTVLTGR